MPDNFAYTPDLKEKILLRNLDPKDVYIKDGVWVIKQTAFTKVGGR